MGRIAEAQKGPRQTPGGTAKADSQRHSERQSNPVLIFFSLAHTVDRHDKETQVVFFPSRRGKPHENAESATTLSEKLVGRRELREDGEMKGIGEEEKGKRDCVGGARNRT